MAEWRPLHQQLTFRSGLETGGQAFDPPLLPYEKALIDTIGCTEEEYKTLVRHAMLRQRVRPAEYDHIPDAVASGVGEAFVINLVIGALLTAASVLLAPKPPSFESGDGKKITGKKLADQVGPSRFNQSTSFDNAPSLAELNSPIPIPFGKRDVGAADSNGSRVATGGLTLVPALVWSRLYAYGRYQAFEGIYVVGEAGLSSPELNGILLGTSALSALGQRDYAFYWSSNNGQNASYSSGNNVPGEANLLFGTQGALASGTVGRQVFRSPSRGLLDDYQFSMAYVPSGDTTFGVSTPIHNGSVYKYNWQVISAPISSVENNPEAKAEIRAKRRKIAGTAADFLHDAAHPAFLGMPGEGRAYSRRMGFIYVNGTQYEYKQDVPVALGALAIFEIYEDDYTWDHLVETPFASLNPDRNSGFGGTEVNLEDLKNSANGWRQRASDLLTIGSRWVCGGVVWMVEARQNIPNPKSIHVNMRCVAIHGDKVEIGVPGYETVRGALGGYEGQESTKRDENHEDGATFVDNSYFNLCALNIATIRPVRRSATAIEIGIRSQVWNKASGLCNFNEIPSPNKLYSLDTQDINLTTGVTDKYFKRSSCFNVWVRPVASAGQPENDFIKINKLFCVQGSAPITQNNFLRIQPQNAGYYEYRLIPRPGSDVVRLEGSTPVYVLQSSEGVPYIGGAGEIILKAEDGADPPEAGAYGTFTITTQGKQVQVRDILHSFEMYTQPPVAPTAGGGEETVGTPVSLKNITEQGNNEETFLTSYAYVTHWLGDPRTSKDQTVSTTIIKNKEPGKSIVLNIAATSRQAIRHSDPANAPIEYPDATHANAAVNGSGWVWTDVQITIQGATGAWKVGERFSIQAVMFRDRDHEKDRPQFSRNTLISGSRNIIPTDTVGFYNVYADYAQQYDVKTGGAVQGSYGNIIRTWEVDGISVADPAQSPLQNYGPGGGRIMEENTQISDCSYYSEIQKSNDSGPEHEVSYVNEYITNNSPASYNDMTTVGFTVKSSGEISGIEQIRVTSGSGIPVNRLIEGDYAPSNLFADLVNYLLTSKTQGVGDVVPAELVDTDSLRRTAKFLQANKIFYDGVLEDSESIRSFLYDTAPLQLCTFTIKNGKFGMQPALPFHETVQADDAIVAGTINATNPIAVDQIFTAGNIIEDSLQLQYIDISQRSNIRAVVTWRVTNQNDLPFQASALLYWADLNSADATEQSFDLSEFCTNREQALRTARFLMSTRRRVTKTVSFKTTPDQLAIEPGSYIRVMTEASVYNADGNGRIGEFGYVTSFVDIEDGSYDALLYGSASQEVLEAKIQISSNRVLDSRFHGYLFSLLTRTTDYSAYQIDSLNLEEDGLVSITAVEVPTDENGRSIVAKDVLDASDDIFTVIE